MAATASDPLSLVPQVAQATAAAGNGSLPASARGGRRRGLARPLRRRRVGPCTLIELLPAALPALVRQGPAVVRVVGSQPDPSGRRQQRRHVRLQLLAPGPLDIRAAPVQPRADPGRAREHRVQPVLPLPVAASSRAGAVLAGDLDAAAVDEHRHVAQRLQAVPRHLRHQPPADQPRAFQQAPPAACRSCAPGIRRGGRRRLTRTLRRSKSPGSRNRIRRATKVRSSLATSKDTWGAVSRGIGQQFS